MKIDETAIECVETNGGSYIAVGYDLETGAMLESTNEYNTERALRRDMATTDINEFWRRKD